MNEKTDIDILAAEYVLGTLDQSEREAVAAQRLSSKELDQSIDEWEQRLSTLNAYVGEATPREGLFSEIETRLNKRTLPHTSSVLKSTKVSSSDVSVIASMRKRVDRWRAAAIGASALAASLAGFIVLQEVMIPAQPQQFVAVFQQDDRQPSFLMAIDIKTRQITIRPVTAEEQPGKTYQLWIKSDQIGPEPQSLGLLTSLDSPIKKQVKYDPDILLTATFGISIEPEGGSPTGVPTGPAIHGTLLPSSI